MEYASGKLSTDSNETLNKVLEQRRMKKKGYKATRFTFHDNSSKGYGWLLDGWIAEERYMSHGRVYRYYYDKMGRFYLSQSEVLQAMEDEAKTIVLDLD